MEALCRLSYSSGGWMMAAPTRGPGSRLRGLTACAGTSLSRSLRRRSPGHITFAGGGVLTVRIADEPDERARGLMGVTDLPTDEGMAFLYGESTDATFWMKDTPIPLSIAFVDQDNRIVTIREMTPCTDDVACRTYASTEPYTKAIEAEAGWFAAHGIEEGDRIRSFDGPFCY
jgi:uncharacterized membrane protein (UPF0127 family)